MSDCLSKYSDDGKIFVCELGAGHRGPHQCYPWSWHDEGAMKPAVPPAMSRALEPEMYNVLAGEIRKLGESVERVEKARQNERESQQKGNLEVWKAFRELSENQQLIMQKLEGEPKPEVSGPLTWNWAMGCYVVAGKRITPEFIEMIAGFGPSVEVLRQEMREGVVAQDIGKVFDRMEGRFEAQAKALGVVEHKALTANLKLDEIISFLSKRARKRQTKPVRRKKGKR